MANYQLLQRLQDKKSNYNVLKWEKDRIDNKKLAQRIDIFSSTMVEPTHSKSRPVLPTLKNPRESTTRMTKKRMKKNYQADLQPLEFPSSFPKRAKTTARRRKRTVATPEEDGDKAKDLDLAKVCGIPEEREVIFQASKNEGK